MYPPIFANFGRFISIFIKMALIVWQSLYYFKLWVHQVEPLHFIAKNEWLFTVLSRLGAMLESYHNAKNNTYYRRKQSTVRWKISAIADMCVGQWWKI